MTENHVRLIEEANIAYHDAEAVLYDASHPEIFWCERSHWHEFARRFLVDLNRPLSLLDVGAGTGFVLDVLCSYLTTHDRYSAVDISEKMVEALERRGKNVPFVVEATVAKSNALPYGDATFAVVTVNSALHHFPDVEGSLRSMARVLRPGGLLVVMHEPSSAFPRSSFSRYLARGSSWFFSRVLSRGRTILSDKRIDYTPVFEGVNRHLLGKGIISVPLSRHDIQALVDCHSPTARGGMDEAGLDPWVWKDQLFPDWKMEWFETYNHLGKIDPTLWWGFWMAEKVLGFFRPEGGSSFLLVLRKP